MNDNNQIIIYQTEDGQTRVDVRMENDTVWLTQAQMAELFKSSRTNIVEHIQHIYDEEELDEISTCRKFHLNNHALITWQSCSDHVVDQALIT